MQNKISFDNDTNANLAGSVLPIRTCAEELVSCTGSSSMSPA